jgi:peptidoglycan/xylan/chitin deacetylase (PgdA/CDA1 family)
MPIPILMYHQIDETPARGTPLRGLTVTPGSFARQMKAFRLLGYQGLSMPALMPYLRGEQQGRVFGITFDDGYLNNLENALPILLENRFSATCYAVSAAPGNVNAWDRPKGIPEKPLMDGPALRAWAKAGMDVGAHTCTHAALCHVSPAQRDAEIRHCKAALENMTGQEVRHFCYPYGEYDEAVRAAVIQAGYESATTVHAGRVRLDDDPYTLPRLFVARTHHLLYLFSRVLWGYEDPRA